MNAIHNHKVEIILKETKYFVLTSNGNDNDDANSNNVVFTLKDKTLYVAVVKLFIKVNQKLSKLLILKHECIGMKKE